MPSILLRLKGEEPKLEGDLIRRAAAGDVEAFTRLVETFSGLLLAVILPVVRDPGLAEDVLQETFLQVYRALPRYRGGSFRHWLARIAVNKAIDWQRQNRRLPETLVASLAPVEAGLTGHSPSVEEVVIWQETTERLRFLCRELPAEYRRTFVGFYLEGKSYQTLAQEEGITVRTVESRLYRARQLLRQRWKEGEHAPL